MKIYSYLGLDDLRFSDNIKVVKSKLARFKLDTDDVLHLNEYKASIYVREINLHIVFKDKRGSRISYFEITKQNLFFEDLDLFNTSYEELKKYFSTHDDSLIDNDDGFDSLKLGIGIYCEVRNGHFGKYPDSIIVFDKDYMDEKVPDVNDIIKFYLGTD